MSARKPLLASLALFCLAGVAAQPALAHRHRPHRHHFHGFGGCAISVNVAPHRITAGDPVVIFGRLRCPDPAKQAGQTVQLFHHLPGIGGFSYVQSTTTDARGFYEFVRADGVVDTSRLWFVRSRGARSGVRAVRVDSQVTLSGPAQEQLFTGFANRVTFTGAVSPAQVGARVILERQSASAGNRWHPIDTGAVDGNGAFTIVHTFVVPGDANIRVFVRSRRRLQGSPSNVLSYAISQAQNPGLTIQASADPIVFGQTVTIGGRLASGAAGVPVTLLARTARQRGFARVAEVQTNGAGEYALPAQAPVNNTFYRVRAVDSQGCPQPQPGKPTCTYVRANLVYSAVLYEGVRDLLTAQASATAVAAGQTVTFSGTVSPDHTGHIVYLERQNASGVGFHVAQIAFLGAGSSYSISHRVYDPGTKVFRVYIPGGPENQGAASEPFTVQVTPASASTLTPEAPNGSAAP